MEKLRFIGILAYPKTKRTANLIYLRLRFGVGNSIDTYLRLEIFNAYQLYSLDQIRVRFVFVYTLDQLII